MNLIRRFRECLNVLSASDQRKYFLIVGIQALLGFLDLIGVAILGMVGIVAINGIKTSQNNEIIVRILDIIHISNFTIQFQVAALGIFAAMILISRTLLSVYFNWRTLKFLANKSAKISGDLITKMANRGLAEFYSNNLSEIQYILGPGVFAIIVGILGTASTIVADLSALIIIAVGVMLIDPAIAMSSIFLFSSIGVFLYLVLRIKVESIGSRLMNMSILSNKLLGDLIIGFRQIFVGNRVGYYVEEIIDTKKQISHLTAVNSFIPSIGKYTIEIAIVFGGTIIAATQFLFNDAARAISGLAIFITAGSRIAPALLRLQQAAIAIKSHMSMSSLTLEAIKKVGLDKEMLISKSETDFTHFGFEPRVSISGLGYSYQASEQFNLAIEDLIVPAGSSLAVVGPSGAGKTTLIDVTLGILHPNKGKVLISGLDPRSAISKWPGAISYVPQDIMIVEGTLAENIALGYGPELISTKYVYEALKMSRLNTYVDSLPEGIFTRIDERGSNLSGGQRQRLGIARALYTQPKLLILDEATSALDGITENEISSIITEKLTEITKIIIAHRLSTVQNSDNVIFLSGGQVIAAGSFEEVRSTVPEFDKSAKLMGL